MIKRMFLKIVLQSLISMHLVNCQVTDDTDAIEVNAIDPSRANINITLVDQNINNNILDVFGNSCTCVPFYQCSSNNTVITDGTGIIDIRMNTESACKSYLEVCCKTPIDESKVPSSEMREPPVQPGGCGKRNLDGVGFRIAGDFNNEAQFGEFPWMVAVLRVEKVDQNTTLRVFHCGGSLIHPQVVMTAAHCVAGRGTEDLFIRAGEWDTQTKQERFPHVDVKVHSAIVHEQFYSGGLHNDIALLVLQRPVNLTENIDTVCLPPQGTIPNIATCTATGWGKDVFGKEGQYQVILKKVDLPIVPRNTCEKQLQTTRLSRYFRLHESFVCAGGEQGRDTCKGDGGGPLVCPIPGVPGRYHQTGIVAWGINCGTQIPGVYVNVALFRHWIDLKMSILNYDPIYYSY